MIRKQVWKFPQQSIWFCHLMQWWTSFLFMATVLCKDVVKTFESSNVLLSEVNLTAVLNRVFSICEMKIPCFTTWQDTMLSLGDSIIVTSLRRFLHWVKQGSLQSNILVLTSSVIYCLAMQNSIIWLFMLYMLKSQWAKVPLTSPLSRQKQLLIC